MHFHIVLCAQIRQTADAPLCAAALSHRAQRKNFLSDKVMSERPRKTASEEGGCQAAFNTL